MLETRAVHILS